MLPGSRRRYEDGRGDEFGVLHRSRSRVFWCTLPESRGTGTYTCASASPCKGSVHVSLSCADLASSGCEGTGNIGFLRYVPPPRSRPDFRYSDGQVFGLISSTIILQANTAFVGAGMGIHPAAVLVFMTLVEVGAVLAIHLIYDAFALQSVKVRNMLERTEETVQGVPLLARSGVVTLVVLPMMPIIGLYSSAVISWVLRWDRLQSLIFITIG